MLENESVKGITDESHSHRNIKVSENRYETKYVLFDKPIQTGIVTDKKPKKMTEEERKQADEANRRSAKTRAVESVIQYAGNNHWQYFSTITFDPKKVDRKDFLACSFQVKRYFKALRQYNIDNNLPELEYLAVPEKHKDGAYHFHALMNNLPSERISRATNNGKELSDKAGRPIFNFDYTFGHTTVVPIGDKNEDQAKVGSYIAKYITKDLLSGIKGAKCYWATRGLKKDTLITRGHIEPGDMAEIMGDLMSEANFKKSINIKPTQNTKHIFVIRKTL